MSVERTRCGHCGFVVVSTDATCPLCEHDLETADFPTSALQALFGG